MLADYVTPAFYDAMMPMIKMLCCYGYDCYARAARYVARLLILLRLLLVIEAAHMLSLLMSLLRHVKRLLR